MWWPTGISQLEVIGVLYSIMNLTAVLKKGENRECFLLSVGRQERERKSKEVNLYLCAVSFL